MKKLLLIAFAVAFATGIVSCKKKESDGMIAIYPTSLQFGFGADTKTILVEEGRNWSVDTDDEWITLEQEDGQFTVTVTENLDPDSRTGHVIISNSDDAKTITVDQEGVDPTITVDPTELIFTYAGGVDYIQEVEVTSQADWEVSSAEEWIKITETETGFNVIVDPYNEPSTRNGAITITNGVATPKMIPVRQSGLIIMDNFDYGTAVYEEYSDNVNNWILDISDPDYNAIRFSLGSSRVTDSYIPAGTYNLAAVTNGSGDDVWVPNVVSIEHSYLDYDDTYTIRFTECTLVIEGDNNNANITFTVVDTNGLTYTGTYSGYYDAW